MLAHPGLQALADMGMLGQAWGGAAGGLLAGRWLVFLGGAVLAGAGQPQGRGACLLAVGGGGAGAGSSPGVAATAAGQAPRDHCANLCQVVDAMPNGLPTGRNGVPRMPLTTPAADAYQATSAVTMPM